MTTRNFRVNNGISVGDVTISASSNKITGLSVSAPSADGDVATKKYVDDSLSGLSQNSISQGDSNITVTDAGIGTVTITADGNTELTIADSGVTVAGTLTASSGVTVSGTLTVNGKGLYPDNVELQFGTDSDQQIYSNGAELIINDNSSGIDIQSGTAVVVKTNGGMMDGYIRMPQADEIELSAPQNGVNFYVGAEGSSTQFATLYNSSGVTLASSVANANINLSPNGTGSTIVNSALTVTGNLTVNGTTTTVNSTNTTIDDNLLELNSGAASNANDCGIIIERGSTGDNAIFMWDESADAFTLGTTTATASDTGDLTIATGTLVANLTGTATAAQYSDVAERFASDSMYEPGTVVALGGAAEITAVAEEASDEVFGVISGEHQAAFKMNGGAGSDATHPYVAMTGRVDVKVIGSVNKGDRLISASVPGYARAATKAECTAFNVIGRALSSKESEGTGSVLAAVRVSH